MNARRRRRRKASRRRFTVAEFEAMVAAGLMDEDERVELIGGEVVPMSPKGIDHEVLKTKLIMEWARRLPNGVLFTPVTTFRLSEDTYLEPDFTFYEASAGLKGLNGGSALLVVEIADFELRLRHRAEGGALRLLRHPRAVGDPRGAA